MRHPPCGELMHENIFFLLFIVGYRLVHWKWFLTMVAMIGSAGLLWLLLYWIPQWKLWWTHEQVCLDEADTVLIEDEYKKDYKR